MAAKKINKKTKKSRNNLSAKRKVSIGIGLTTAAVAAAGAYFLYGSPNAKKNRRKVKSWMLNAKAEVLGALERAENMTEAEYNNLVEKVGKTYSKLQDASKADVVNFKKEMKRYWPKIVKAGKALTKTVVKVVKKTVKKTSRKLRKKVAKRSSKPARAGGKSAKPANARRKGRKAPRKTSKRK